MSKHSIIIIFMGDVIVQKYFAGDYSGGDFILFSPSHIVTLSIIIAIIMLIYIFRNSLREERVNKSIRYIIAALLILQELSYDIWYIYIGEWFIGDTLPLHLCGISVVLSAIMLFRKSYSIYEIVYFWGVGGASQALLTPAIGVYGFPHYRFFQFFISHGLIVIACLYATFVFEYRPNMKSLWKAFKMLNIYMVIMAVFNFVTKGNYLFICSKPETASILDYLGPWPWYILSLEFVAVIMFLIIYAPFALHDYFVKRKAQSHYESM